MEFLRNWHMFVFKNVENLLRKSDIIIDKIQF